MRNRLLPFSTLILFLSNFLKGSLQDESDQFFQSINQCDVSERVVTRSAISQARRKISHGAFIDLLDKVCDCIHKYPERLMSYRGKRVFAIDGSTLRLPNTPEIRQEFGAAKGLRCDRPMARISLLHDVLNRITYDAALSPYRTSEQDMAWQHLEDADLPKESLILLDRGYVDYALLRTIQDQGHDFCIRLRSDLKVYKAFKRSGKQEMVTQFKPTKQTLAMASPESPFRKPINVRLVRFVIEKQEYILMTTLLDTRAFPLIEIVDLYHQRWQIEESYKVKKCRMRIEDMSGMTPEIIRQDFHAKVFAECLTAALTLELRDHVDAYCLTTKNEYQVSLTQALAKMKNTIALIFIRPKPIEILTKLLQILMKSLVERAPGRKFRRKSQGKNPPKLQTQCIAYKYNR